MTDEEMLMHPLPPKPGPMGPAVLRYLDAHPKAHSIPWGSLADDPGLPEEVRRWAGEHRDNLIRWEEARSRRPLEVVLGSHAIRVYGKLVSLYGCPHQMECQVDRPHGDAIRLSFTVFAELEAAVDDALSCSNAERLEKCEEAARIGMAIHEYLYAQNAAAVALMRALHPGMRDR